MQKYDAINVVTSEGSDTADILMYGYIGQTDYWGDGEDDITDVELARTIRNLESKYNRINIRINSPGGSMYHGNAIINAIRNSSAEIHTYNDGMAASMAAVIFMASPNRHMANNALLMLHVPSGYSWGNAKDFRDTANMLDKFEETIINVISETTAISAEEVKARYFEDYKDHWLSCSDCIAEGLIESNEEYEAENAPKSDVMNSSYLELIKNYTNQQEVSKPVSRNLFQRIAAAFRPTPKTHQHNHISTENTTDMSIEELKQSLADGTLSPDAANAAIQEAKDNQQINAKDFNNKLAAATQPLLEKIETMQNRIDELSDKPAAPTTGVAATKDPDANGTPSVKDELDTYNSEMAAHADRFDNPFTGAID